VQYTVTSGNTTVSSLYRRRSYFSVFCFVLKTLNYRPLLTVSGQLPPHFGLLDNSPDRWTHFKSKISALNREAASGTLYKVFFLGRHGEGHRMYASTCVMSSLRVLAS